MWAGANAWCNPTIHGTRLFVPGHTDSAIAHREHKRTYGLCLVIASWIILSFSEESLAHLGNSLPACRRSDNSKHHGRSHSAPAPAPRQDPPAKLTGNNLGPPEPPQRSKGKGPLPPRRPVSRYCSAIAHHCVLNPTAATSAELVGDGPYSSNPLRNQRNPQARPARSVRVRMLRQAHRALSALRQPELGTLRTPCTYVTCASAQAFPALQKGLRSALLA